MNCNRDNCGEQSPEQEWIEKKHGRLRVYRKGAEVAEVAKGREGRRYDELVFGLKRNAEARRSGRGTQRSVTSVTNLVVELYAVKCILVQFILDRGGFMVRFLTVNVAEAQTPFLSGSDFPPRDSGLTWSAQSDSQPCRSGASSSQRLAPEKQQVARSLTKISAFCLSVNGLVTVGICFRILSSMFGFGQPRS